MSRSLGCESVPPEFKVPVYSNEYVSITMTWSAGQRLSEFLHRRGVLRGLSIFYGVWVHLGFYSIGVYQHWSVG